MAVWLSSLCLCLCKLLVPGAAKPSDLPRFTKKWWSLGPFASGKVEYDGDPLVPLGGARLLFERGPGSGSKTGLRETFLTEHAVGGSVKWRGTETRISDDGVHYVQLPHDHIPFQGLMQSPPLGGSSDVLHVQYWVVGTVKVKMPGRYGFNCRGLHTFEIVKSDSNASSIGPLAGNIYSDALGVTPVDLIEEGTYRLMARVRGKVPMQFGCSIQTIQKSLQANVYPKNFPDVVLGTLLAGPSPVDVRVLNAGDTWLNVRAEVKHEGNSKTTKVHGASSQIRLAPGTMAALPVVISVQGPAIEKDAAACVQVELDVVGDGPERQVALTVPLQLRCRRSTQSALLSFLDVDGSVGVAAVLRPNDPPPGVESLPIVVSMSGVGVEPQQQADAYKMKPSPSHQGDYIFGYEGMWVLTPHRGGPHNWEDVGMHSALRAIEVLAASQESPRADPERLIVHGHSRGGHGAWGLAERQPDRVLGVASACGWYSREEYGDANNLWVHETSLMHLDKMLLGILHASVAENENSLHASNLRGMPALVRTASQDKAVPPWFGRRMARHMKEEGVNVTFEEYDQEHWWWDTKETNDGGVLHDPSMRSWTLSALERGRVELPDVLKAGEFVLTASSPEYMGRFGIQVLQRTSPSSRAFIRVSQSGEVTLRTANVRRFAVHASSQAAVLMNGTALVDGASVAFNVNDGVELCLDKSRANHREGTCAADTSESSAACTSRQRGSRWLSCSESTGAPPLTRSLELLGPIRRVFAMPWVVVIPDEPSSLEMRLAAYFATGHVIAVNTATQTLTYSDARALRSSHRFVWLGSADRFPAEAREHWPISMVRSDPVDEDIPSEFSLAVGPCVFGKGHGAVSLAPAAVEGDAAATALLDLVVTATDPQALVDLVSFSFATNQPHTRAPMSNMLPDFLVAGPEFRWRGYGGVVAAGYFDADWRVAPNAAYFQC